MKVQRHSSSLLKSLLSGLLVVCCSCGTLAAQSKRSSKQSKKQPEPVNELARLREEFIKATKDYKASLEKLQASYEKSVTDAEKRLADSEKLFSDGLISKSQLEESKSAVVTAKARVSDVQHQLQTADTQIANTLLEADTEAKLSRLARNRKGLITTSSYIRYTGSVAWGLSDAWKVQRFFQDTFKHPLPIAVFGQGGIHDRWRLDHRNAMDLSLHPDGVEGQAVINFLRANGIPFLAFREAIPGTATGPHIHVGRPSHRY